MESLPLQITAMFAGILALLLMALSINVVRHRARTQISLGEGGDARLHEAGRVFGNCAEYVPIVLILMATAELNGASPTLLYVTGALILAGRVIHPFGITNDKAYHGGPGGQHSPDVGGDRRRRRGRPSAGDGQPIGRRRSRRAPRSPRPSSALPSVPTPGAA